MREGAEAVALGSAEGAAAACVELIAAEDIPISRQLAVVEVGWAADQATDRADTSHPRALSARAPPVEWLGGLTPLRRPSSFAPPPPRLAAAALRPDRRRHAPVGARRRPPKSRREPLRTTSRPARRHAHGAYPERRPLMSAPRAARRLSDRAAPPPRRCARGATTRALPRCSRCTRSSCSWRAFCTHTDGGLRGTRCMPPGPPVATQAPTDSMRPSRAPPPPVARPRAPGADPTAAPRPLVDVTRSPLASAARARALGAVLGLTLCLLDEPDRHALPPPPLLAASLLGLLRDFARFGFVSSADANPN